MRLRGEVCGSGVTCAASVEIGLIKSPVPRDALSGVVRVHYILATIIYGI